MVSVRVVVMIVVPPSPTATDLFRLTRKAFLRDNPARKPSMSNHHIENDEKRKEKLPIKTRNSRAL